MQWTGWSSGFDPHKLSVTIEARDNREILRATGRFGTDARSYRRRRHLRREQASARPRTSTWHRQMSQPDRRLMETAFANAPPYQA